MTAPPSALFHQMESSFHFEFHAGESTLVKFPHTTGWRSLPALVAAQTHYTSRLELADGRVLRVNPGEALVIAPGVAHRATKVSRRAGFSHWAHVDCEVLPGVSLFVLTTPPIVVKGRAARKLGELCSALGKLVSQSPSLPMLLHRQALGWQLVELLVRNATFNSLRLDSLRYAARLAPVLAYMETHLAETITHGQLARVTGLSPSRFHAVFRAAFGCAPYEYAQRLRLRRAQELLLRTDKAVFEISHEVGYMDPFHFSRTFRQHAGVSPLQYRKQMKQSAW